jgi:hypothetical protein
VSEPWRVRPPQASQIRKLGPERPAYLKVQIPQGKTLVDDMFRLGTDLYLLVAFIVNQCRSSRSVAANGAEIIGTRSGRHFVTYARSSCYPCAPWARYDDQVVGAVSRDEMKKARATQQENGKTAFPCASSLLLFSPPPLHPPPNAQCC